MKVKITYRYSTANNECVAEHYNDEVGPAHINISKYAATFEEARKQLIEALQKVYHNRAAVPEPEEVEI